MQENYGGVHLNIGREDRINQKCFSLETYVFDVLHLESINEFRQLVILLSRFKQIQSMNDAINFTLPDIVNEDSERFSVG